MANDVSVVVKALDSERTQTALSQSLQYHDVPVDRFCAVVKTAIQRRPDLLKVDLSDLLLELRKCADDGLLLDDRLATIVTFNTKTGTKGVYIPMVQGVYKRLRETGTVLKLYAAVVYANDRFDYQLGMEPRIDHTPEIREERGEIIGAYAIANLPNGENEIEFMTRDELDAVKAASRAQNGPWSGPFADEMRKKTVVKRLAKRLPINDQVADMMSREDEAVYDLNQPAITQRDRAEAIDGEAVLATLSTTGSSGHEAAGEATADE